MNKKIIIILFGISIFSMSFGSDVSAEKVQGLVSKYENLYKKFNTVKYRTNSKTDLKKIEQLITKAKINLNKKNIEQAYYEISICPHYFKKIQEHYNLKDLDEKYNALKKKINTGNK